MSVTDKRVALVTAGSGGIGRGIVEGLLADGFSVAFTGRSAARGEKALAELGVGERALFLSGDAHDRDDVRAWVTATVEQLGRLDVLVNNAGGSDGFAPIHELTDEAWDGAMDFIINSTFWATRAALPHLVASGAGRVINISSVEGKLGNKANVAHYITAKHAVNGFTKAVAFEYGRQGVTSNAIIPGAVETERTREIGPTYAAENGMTYEEYLGQYTTETATGRLNEVDEIAAMVRLLVGPAGRGISGALLNVDGGTSPY